MSWFSFAIRKCERKQRKVKGGKVRIEDGQPMTKEGWYEFDVKIWIAKIWLFVGSQEEMRNSGKEKFKDDPEMLDMIERCRPRREEYDGITITSGLKHLINVPKFQPFVADDLVTLMHETLHVSMKMLHAIGVEMNPETSESLAYTQQYVFSSLYKRLAEGAR